MANKVAVITGANAGLGFQAARKLARMGTTIVMACRSMEKAKQAQNKLQAEMPDAKTSIIPLDVSEPDSIREFVRSFSEQVGQLDLLINNAGIVAIPLARNSVGSELQLATNYLGTFALTAMLLPFFRKDTPGRIINVGSLAHRFGKLDLDDFNWERTPYNEWQGYARSKVAMLSFTMELNRRLRASGSNVVAVGAHPGFAATDILRHNPARQERGALTKWFEKQMQRLVPSAEQASAPIVHAAVAEYMLGGDYYGPTGFLEIAGKPGKARINRVAKDAEIGKRLWFLSEQMTGVEFLSRL